MTTPDAASPNVAITYCRLCGWLLRASWMAQELLTTFADGKLIWSRAEHHRFPDIKELKQLVRDQVAPERALGHSDAKPAQS